MGSTRSRVRSRRDSRPPGGTTRRTRSPSPPRRRPSTSPRPTSRRTSATFAGIGRRLERKGEAAGVTVYDDYGHHPTAIRETLAAVRQREPGRRVWAVYEPLTYHRTAAMLGQFAEVLAGADAVAIADVWAGRDPDTTIASAARLAEAIASRRPGLPVLAPGPSTPPRTGWPRRSAPATSSWSWAAAASYRIAERLLERLEERG